MGATAACAAAAEQVVVLDLAAAVNCSGGSFEVDWKGTIAVGELFDIVDGTAITMSGEGSTAVIDGNGSTRLFIVVNTSLHFNHVNISSGASGVGGAVAAAGSSLAFNGTNFVGNKSSYVSCVGGGVFADNRAAMHGEALFATGTSEVSCGGSWLNNTAGNSGGVVRIHQVSAMSWKDEAVFAYNTASKNSGSVSLYNQSSLSWSGTKFRGTLRFTAEEPSSRRNRTFLGTPLVGARSQETYYIARSGSHNKKCLNKKHSGDRCPTI
ncbi:unnamed protein product [Ectocarpus sp. CCAP 1310/34]|nr:unnamed protein product [Ectocarpus sp. CCAP 1310/34]